MPSPLRRALIALFRSAEVQLVAALSYAISSGGLVRRKDRNGHRSKAANVLAELRVAGLPQAMLVVEEAYSNGASRVDPAPQLSGIERETVKVLGDALGGRLDDATRTVGRRADDVLRREGLRQAAVQAVAEAPIGQATTALRDRLLREGVTSFVDKAGRQWGLENYAAMAVQTISAEAQTEGVKGQMLGRGLDLVDVSSHTCSHHPKDPSHPCRRYEGETLSLTGATPGYPTELPPYHPNAVMAGTEVEPVGELRGGCEARWRGPLCELTTRSGVRLPIGPNHPVLTGRGWLPAKLVREGDYVIRRDSGDGLESLSGAQHDLDYVPARVEDVVESLAAVGDDAWVVAAAHHLHGDGNFCEGEVHVVRADRLLAGVADPALHEMARESEFVMAYPEPPTLSRGGARELGFNRRGSLVARSLTDRHLPGAQPTHEGASTEWASLSDVLSAFAGQVTLDQVVEVRDREWFAGQAFDLETESSVYFAEGLLVHNCTHYIVPSRQAFAARAA